MEAQKESLKLKGHIKFVLKDKDGKIKEVREIDNLIVNAGKSETAGLLIGDTGATAFGYIAIGTGTTAPSASDTALETETHRASATTSLTTTNVTNDTAQLEATFNFTSSYAITESGIFNDATAGDMLARQTFSALNVANGDSLTVTWKITVS